MARRRSLASATPSVLAPADDSLFHVGQRLDALAADDDHAVFYFSRVATPTTSVSVSASAASSSLHHHHHNRVLLHHHARARAATLTTRRRRRRKPLLSRVLGLSAFYARTALLVGTAWAVAAFAVVAATAAMDATPLPLQLRVTSTTGASLDRQRQTAHELAGLSAGAALGTLLGGSLGDHYGRRRVLLAATAGGAVAQVLAGAGAWCHVSLLVARSLAGLALGGQLVLFPIALGELAAQRHRGRVIVAALAGVPLGALLAIHSAQWLAHALGWRVFTAAVLGGAQTLVLVALTLLLRDSPRFLAAIGRVESALAIVETVERAHGIDRNARVPLPSSLFEPPVQSMPDNHDFTINHDDQDQGHIDGHTTTQTPIPMLPPPLPPHATHHQPQHHQRHQQRRRRTSVALTPRMVSLGASLRKRWRRVLWCAPYAKRSLGLTLLWVLVAGGLSTTIGAASRFTRDAAATGAPRFLSTYVTAAGVVGLLASAAVLDRCGRVPLFLLSLLVSSLATTLVGMQLFMALRATVLLGVACALLACASVVALGTAVLWTLESYGVLIRATGMGLAFTGMGVGVGIGQWLAWSPWLSDDSVPYVLWGVAAVFLALALGTWLGGSETRGLEDVDAVVMAPEPSGRRSAAHAGLSANGAGSGDRDGSDKLPVRQQLHRTTYHSKDTTHDDEYEYDQDDDHESDQDASTATTTTVVSARARARAQRPSDRDSRRALETGASTTSEATTYIGSTSSRTSSARFSSVRFSSQRTLSSGHTSTGRDSRGSSLSRQQHLPHQQQRLTQGSVPASSSYRRRDNALSSTRADQTPPFVIRRSSLTRSSSTGGAYGPTRSLSGGRRSGNGSQLSYGRRSGSGNGSGLSTESRRDSHHRTERLQAQAPRVSFGAARFSLSELTTSLPARLDPHSVREHLGRRSSEADRSSSSSDDLGIAPEHDVMTIDIDPFEDDDDMVHGAFVTVPTPMPMLG